MSISEKLTTIAKNVPKVYGAGKQDGQQTEYDKFWDNFQDYGNRKYYYAAFCGQTWTKEIFKPKYDMHCTAAYMLFYMSKMNVDLVEQLDGIILDLSKASRCKHAFATTQFTRIGVMNLSSCVKADDAEYLFSTSTLLVTIDEIVFPPKGVTVTGWFDKCESLENVKFSGTFNSNNINLQWSPKLTHESLLSLLNCLPDKSSDISGTEWKITIGSTNMTKLTFDELNIAYTKGWMID